MQRRLPLDRGQATVDGGQGEAVGSNGSLTVGGRQPETAVTVITDRPEPQPARVGFRSFQDVGVEALNVG